MKKIIKPFITVVFISLCIITYQLGQTNMVFILNSKPMANATVTFQDTEKEIIYEMKTNNNGEASLRWRISSKEHLKFMHVKSGNFSESIEYLSFPKYGNITYNLNLKEDEFSSKNKVYILFLLFLTEEIKGFMPISIGSTVGDQGCG